MSYSGLFYNSTEKRNGREKTTFFHNIYALHLGNHKFAQVHLGPHGLGIPHCGHHVNYLFSLAAKRFWHGRRLVMLINKKIIWTEWTVKNLQHLLELLSLVFIWCSHKGAIESHGHGIPHFGHHVDPLPFTRPAKGFWHGRRLLMLSNSDFEFWTYQTALIFWPLLELLSLYRSAGYVGPSVGFLRREGDRSHGVRAAVPARKHGSRVLRGRSAIVHIRIAGAHCEPRVHRCTQLRPIHGTSREVERPPSHAGVFLTAHHRGIPPCTRIPLENFHRQETDCRLNLWICTFRRVDLVAGAVHS